MAERFAYNEDNSLRQVVNRDTASHILTQHDYAYDGVGQRASQVDNMAGTTYSNAYTYDELKRLVGVNASVGGQTSFRYDPLGNRTAIGDANGNPFIALQYDAANQLTQASLAIANFTPTPINYDANGNLTSDGSRTYTWDALDQLSQVSHYSSGVTVAYRYDDSGRRISKATGGTTTQWTYDGQDIYAEYPGSWSTPNAVYTSGGAIDDPVIRAIATGPSTYGMATYYHADGLGSVVGTSNNADASTQTQRFDAFGNKLGGTIAQSAQYGFTGREPDETGLVYMRARYYSADFYGRFVSRDPAGLQGGINAYAYCGNNPVNCTDPSGLMPQSALSSFVDSSYFGMGTQGADSSYVTTAARNALNSARDYVSNIPSAVSNFVSNIPTAASNLATAFQQSPFQTTRDVLEALTGNGPGGFVAGVGALGTVARVESIAAQGMPLVGGGAKLENLTAQEIARIQNAANRTGTEISVVRSRARGTPGPLSDWDYVVPEATGSRTIHSLRSSLPEGPRSLGEPRNQDFFRSLVDPTQPFITFMPH